MIRLQHIWVRIRRPVRDEEEQMEEPETPAGEDTQTDEQAPDESLPPDEAGEPTVPDDGGVPVEVVDDATWVGAVVGEAEQRYAKMTANPAHRGDPATTMSAWVLSNIDTPHEQRTAIEDEALKRVETLKQNGANDAYIRRQLAGKIVNGDFD